VLSRAGNLLYNICLDFPATLFGPRFRDVTSGFRMYSRQAMHILSSEGLESRSFDVMLETAHILRARHLHIEEVQTSYRYSNSSLNAAVVVDCIHMCVKLLTRTMYRKARRLCFKTVRTHKKSLTSP
jgi:hypothetical protein